LPIRDRSKHRQSNTPIRDLVRHPSRQSTAATPAVAHGAEKDGGKRPKNRLDASKNRLQNKIDPVKLGVLALNWLKR
jgi:hypothetical protein